jgi:hypothetical protein
MQEDPPDIAEENESLETTAANPLANLRAKLDKLQRLGLMVQTVLDDIACAMERCGVSWLGGWLAGWMPGWLAAWLAGLVGAPLCQRDGPSWPHLLVVVVER